jgi:hypothetical protein
MAKILLEEISSEKVRNQPLRELIEMLQQGHRHGIDPLKMTPDTAQRFQVKDEWVHHTDYHDHHNDHSDYCD